MNNFSNIKKYLIVFLGLTLSFYASVFFIKNVFLANSPKIRPNLGSYYLAKIKNSFNKVSNFIALKSLNKINLSLNQNNQLPINQQNTTSKSRELIIEELSKSLKPITKGVSAVSKPGYSYTLYKINEIEWAEIRYTLKNGEEVVIQYPKGTNPPPKEIYEKQ